MHFQKSSSKSGHTLSWGTYFLNFLPTSLFTITFEKPSAVIDKKTLVATFEKFPEILVICNAFWPF